jgi:hypothetical protein
MIVHEDDRRGSLSDRLAKYFSRVDERRIEESAGYGDVALQPVLRIEDRDVELLNRKIFEALSKDLVHISGPAHRRALLSFLGRHAPAELERCMDSNRTSRSYTIHAGQSGYRLGGEQAERASARR